MTAVTGTHKKLSVEYLSALAVQKIGRTLAYLNLDYRGGYESKTPVPASVENANVVTSLLPNGNHAPCIDLDFPAYLIPSTTPGHFHLYLEKELSWKEYEKLLKAMSEVGIIEKNYYSMSEKIKQTVLRLPYIKKPAKRTYSSEY